METLETRVKVLIEVEDQETGDVVDLHDIDAWGNPGYVVRLYIDDKVVHKHIIAEPEVEE